MRQGEVERARVDAENQARARAMQQQQDHERQLAALSQDKKKKQLTWVVVAIGAVLVFGGAGGGYAFWSTQQESARIQALKDQEIAAKQQQLDKLMADLKAQQDQMTNAQAELANAKSDADRANAQAKLAAAQQAQATTQRNIAAVKAGAAKPAKRGPEQDEVQLPAGRPALLLPLAMQLSRSACAPRTSATRRSAGEHRRSLLRWISRISRPPVKRRGRSRRRSAW